MRFNDVGVLVEIAIFNQKKALASASAFFNDVFRCRRDPHFLWWIVTAKKAAKDAKQNPADKDGTVTEPDDCA